MALNDISLTSSMRSNLIALQNTATLLSRTQDRLSTGKKVNTALDNPTNFFAAQANTQRANDLSTRKDAMTEAVQGVDAANKGITGITSLIEAAKGLTQAARSADATNRDSLGQQFNAVLTQISQLASDSGYKGKNFLTNDSLNVLFNENGSSSLTISGFDATADGLGISGVVVAVSGAVTAGTAITDTIGVTGTNSGNLTGASTTLNVVTHSGSLSSSSGIAGYVGTGNVFGNGGALTTTSGTTGDSFTVSGLGFTGYSQLAVTGNYVLEGVTVDGVATATGNFAIDLTNSTSGHIVIKLTGGAVTGTYASGQSIAFNLQTAAHFSSGSGVPANLTVYNLKAGDIASGLSVLDSSGNGFEVYVSGQNVATGSVTLDTANNQLIFTGVGVPLLNNVTYTYNDGYASGQGIGARTMSNLSYTGTALATGQSIVQVRVKGVAIDSGYYAITGSSITFTSGAVYSGIIHSGDNIGISVETKGYTYTAAVSGTQYITTGSVQIDGVALTGADYVLTDSTIKIDSGFFASGQTTGASITYTVTSNAIAGGWATDTGIDLSVSGLNTAIDTLRTKSANLASNLSVVTIREDFTDGLVNTLLKGADNLTLADMNQEGANMLMLQTRQQLGTTSLKMASDAAQSVLRLF